MMKSSLLALLIACCGCRSNPDSQVRGRYEAEELEFITSVLQREHGEYFATGALLPILGPFSLGILAFDDSSLMSLSGKLLSEASDSLPPDLVRDFISKCGAAEEVWPELESRLPMVVLSRAVQDSSESMGVERFLEHRPDLRDRLAKAKHGPIVLSRVGFNRDRTLALWYYGGKMGGNLLLFHKEGSDWMGRSTKYGWVI